MARTHCSPEAIRIALRTFPQLAITQATADNNDDRERDGLACIVPVLSFNDGEGKDTYLPCHLLAFPISPPEFPSGLPARR